MAPVCAADRTLLPEKRIVQRLPDQVSQLTINVKSEPRPVKLYLDDTAALLETQKALNQGKYKAQTGSPRVVNEGQEAIVIELTELIQMFWEEDSVPQDGNDVNTIHLQAKSPTITTLEQI